MLPGIVAGKLRKLARKAQCLSTRKRLLEARDVWRPHLVAPAMTFAG